LGEAALLLQVYMLTSAVVAPFENPKKFSVMFKYSIKYNVYTPDEAPKEQTSEEFAASHMDEQGLKRILETKHGAQITLISWKEMTEQEQNN
jgi:hypothetical protein